MHSFLHASHRSFQLACLNRYVRAICGLLPVLIVKPTKESSTAGKTREEDAVAATVERMVEEERRLRGWGREHMSSTAGG